MTPMTMTPMTVGAFIFLLASGGVLFVKSNYLDIDNDKYVFANDDKNRSVSSVSSSSIRQPYSPILVHY